MTESASSILTEALRMLKATGTDGFEGLIAQILSHLTGVRFLLAASGRQEGRDLRARGHYGTHIAVECKRYGSKTPLDERELIAELAQVSKSLPHLDLWVLATSRSVPDLLEQQLESEAQRHGVAFAILDCPTHSMGTLAALCAEYSDEVLSRLPDAQKKTVANALDKIRGDKNFPGVIEGVRKIFLQSWIGFDQARRASHLKLRRRLSDESESRAAFLQNIAVADAAMPRALFLEKASAWYEGTDTSRKSLVVVGEEGDGKTWLVANWLYRQLDQPDCPLALFLPASAVTDTDPATLLSHALAANSGTVSAELWRKRLQRWVDEGSPVIHPILLVLDGINEKFSHTHWLSLFTRLDTPTWREHLLIVTTCRLAYWETKLLPGLRGLFENLQIAPYDDCELNAALREKSLSLATFSPAIVPLLRKPRYFDLAVRHRQRLADSGDITVARLLYEDWRDRYGRRIGLPLDPGEFNELLKRIADRAREGEQRLRMSALNEDFPPLDDNQRQELYTELVSGGVLSNAPGGRIEVVSDRLSMGFGLLLVDRTLDAHQLGNSLSEAISQWLEPAPGIDEKSRIVEHASLHALILENCPDEVRIQLLYAWLNLQNRDDPECRNFIRYLPQRPETFFKLAQALWATPAENAWGQQLLLEGVLHWKFIPSVHTQAVKYATIWLGYILSFDSLDGENNRDEILGKQRVESRMRLETNLAGRPVTEIVNVGSFELRPIHNEGLLRLGRVALAYISQQPRAEFVHSIVTGILAESVQAHLSKLDVFSWVIRTAPDSETLKRALFEEVEALCGIENMPKAIAAAHQTLRLEGSSDSVARKSMLPEESVSDLNRHHEKYLLDPCLSIFSWTREDCAQCLGRSDVPIRRLANYAKLYLRDPDFPKPPALTDRLRSTEIIEPDLLWQQRQFSYAESELESIESTFHACAPDVFAQKMRKVFADGPNRDGDKLWALIVQVDDYSLLLDEENLKALQQIWQLLPGQFSGQDLRQLEWTLFNELLLLWSPEEQLQRLLARSPDAFDLRDFVRNFKAVPSGLCESVSIPEDEASARRVAWFLSRSSEFLRSRLFPQMLEHANSFIRSMAFKAIYYFGDQDAWNGWLTRGWCHTSTMHREESYWGSRLLIDSHSVDPTETMERIDPAYVLKLGEARGWVPSATSTVVDYLLRWLAEMSENVRLATVASLPAMKIADDLHASPTDAFSVTISNIAPDRSIRLISPSIIWGGTYASGNLSNEIFQEESDSEWQVRSNRVVDAVQSARSRGAYWLDDLATVEAIEQILEADPSIETKLLQLTGVEGTGSDNFIVESYGLLVPLCSHLLNKNPNVGAQLYRRLTARKTAVNQVAGGTELDWVDIVLFQSYDSIHVRALWEETLENCKSDGDLISLTMLTRNGDARAWIEYRVSADKNASSQFVRARAILMAGLLGLTIPKTQPKTWHSDVAELATQYQDVDRWGREWFDRFVTAEADAHAFSAFKLLLECVDRRFWTWKETLIASHSEPISARRTAFLNRNIGNIKTAIKRNEKSMFESFLTMKVAEGQVWPWLSIQA